MFNSLALLVVCLSLSCSMKLCQLYTPTWTGPSPPYDDPVMIQHAKFLIDSYRAVMKKELIPLQESNDDHSSLSDAETIDASAPEISTAEPEIPSENLEARLAPSEQDAENNDESSTNQILWLLVIIAIVAIPVALAIRRILRSTPK